MKYTKNLNLPIYDNPYQDKFDLSEWNEANEAIDSTYGELKVLKDEITSVNPNVEIIDARCGEKTLGDKIRKIDLKISTLETSIKKYEEFVVDNDWTLAFEKAFAENKIVNVPQGTYNVKYIRIPSNSMLIGSGIDATIFNAIADTTVNNIITNKDYEVGNTDIVIKNFTVIGNRLTTTPPNGYGSCVTFANVKNGLCENVRAESPSLHCFDTMADRPYQLLNPNYTSNIYYNESKRSRNIIFKNCRGKLAFDDTFTFHYSDYIYAINCVAEANFRDPNATGSDNRNGFEIDDGSTHCYIMNCVANGNARGFEIKAHDHSPAPENCSIIDSVANDCVIGFQARHIGMHLANEPKSNAKNITIRGCRCYNPKVNQDFPTLAAQAMQISAYEDVVVDDFIAEGANTIDPTRSVIGTQYKSRRVKFNNIVIKGFTDAEVGLNFVGGDQRTDDGTATNIYVDGCRIGVAVGSEIYNCRLEGLDIKTRTPKGIETTYGVYMSNSNPTVRNINSNSTYAIHNGSFGDFKNNNMEVLLYTSPSGQYQVGGSNMSLAEPVSGFDYLIVEFDGWFRETRLLDMYGRTTGNMQFTNISESTDVAGAIEFKFQRDDANQSLKITSAKHLDLVPGATKKDLENTMFGVTRISGLRTSKMKW